MEKTTKITKNMVLNFFNTQVDNMDFDGAEVTVADVKAFIAKSIEQNDNKAVAAKIRNAKKKAETDALTDAVYAVLTSEPQTRDAITSQVTGDDITAAKVGSRLTKLIEAGRVTKTEIKLDKRKVCGYVLAD